MAIPNPAPPFQVSCTCPPPQASTYNTKKMPLFSAKSLSCAFQLHGGGLPLVCHPWAARCPLRDAWQRGQVPGAAPGI